MATAAKRVPRTVEAMRRIGARHIDNRRNLLPRDYMADPWTFGSPAGVVIMPAGGDAVSQRVADHHHRLVVAIHAGKVRTSEICQQFDFGRDLWSDVLAGRRWPGETVLVAMVETLIRPSERKT